MDVKIKFLDKFPVACRDCDIGDGYGGECHADVHIGNVVFIFVDKTTKFFEARTKFFQELGYRVVWLFDGFDAEMIAKLDDESFASEFTDGRPDLAAFMLFASDTDAMALRAVKITYDGGYKKALVPSHGIRLDKHFACDVQLWRLFASSVEVFNAEIYGLDYPYALKAIHKNGSAICPLDPEAGSQILLDGRCKTCQHCGHCHARNTEFGALLISYCCWPHVIREAGEPVGITSDHEYYELFKASHKSEDGDA